ncbi:MAG: arginase [Alphaproteobacteria bacterium]|nr:arginase [Alphaproteobacteria bacterium]
MQLCLLHLDDALKSQPEFMQTCERDGAQQIEAMQAGAEIRLWGRESQLDMLHAILAEQFAVSTGEPRLCFMGSGDFHHVTALLLQLTLKNQSEPATVIHFDNHPDWVSFESGVHCGSWINCACAHPKISRLITIGACSGDLKHPDRYGAIGKLLSDGVLELFPYRHPPSRVKRHYGAGASHQQKDKHIHWQTIERMGEHAFAKILLQRISTKNVYITIDKDVLAAQDADTNWDQGQMRLSLLLELLFVIGGQHTIIGADVTGDYSTPRFGGDLWTRIKKRVEIIIDHPWNLHRHVTANALNSASNLALLEVFSEVMS